MTNIAKLALEDGTVFTGKAFGAAGEVDGEVCFNTSMTGYQEILTDPSYRGQIVTMTYPEIGNYGVNAQDVESAKPHLAGFIVREQSGRVSNFRADGNLNDYLRRHGIVALEGIDTRSLVRRLRTQGAMKGVLSTTDLDDARLVAKAKASPGLVGRDLVREVIPDGPIQWTRAAEPLGAAGSAEGLTKPVSSIVAARGGPGLRHEVEHRPAPVRHGLPGDDPAGHGHGRRKFCQQQPDGVFLSNGPGDPEPLDYAQQTIRGLLGKKPIFGICLGHQLWAWPAGRRPTS